MYTAQTLINTTLEFTEMTPNPAEWNRAALRDNPPREIRFRQIEALMKAFLPDAGTHSIQSFLSGDFITARSEADYEKLWAYMCAYVKEVETEVEERPVSIAQLRFIFPKMLDYKRKLRSVTTFNSGWLEASLLSARFSIYMTDSISKNLEGKTDKLDDVLAWFVDPRERSYTMDELVKRFGYPKENLRDIDMEYM